MARKLQPQNQAAALAALSQRIIACERCPRLREYCAEVARVRRRAYRDQEYWGRPVPSFGDPDASVLLVGLAPGAHGSNRTGRNFTGDGSGDFLFPTLYEAGYASQPRSVSRDDGMQLHGMRINAMARCAPPDNKPLPQELRNCSAWFDEEVALLPRLRVFVCLGKIAFDGVMSHLVRSGRLEWRAGFTFAHGAEFTVPAQEGKAQWRVLASYHPSLQNTNTGRLTRPMFLKIFQRARELASLCSAKFPES
jgi:uracil-DNA glycosylase family 4